MERCRGRVLVSVLVVALSLAAVLVAWASLSVARARRALTMPVRVLGQCRFLGSMLRTGISFVLAVLMIGCGVISEVFSLFALYYQSDSLLSAR